MTIRTRVATEEYREIQLSQGCVALVDLEDYAKLAPFRWHCDHGYACRNAVKREDRKGYLRGYMHREVLSLPRGGFPPVDHINGNTLDNRKANLRVASAFGNAANRRPNKGKPLPKGVSFHKQTGKYQARISQGRRLIHLGLFASPQEAAIAYNEAAKVYHGEYARLNEVAA